MEHTDTRELESAVEGILFASGEPVQTERICLALSLEREEVERILHRLRDYYAFERRGMRLLQLEDRWQLCSSPDYADVIRKAFEIRKPAKLSQPALEALTIIAYYQPTTRAYVDKLRGVDSSYTVGLLLERGLIETCGNLQAPGRPLLYRTTEKFLRSFHISSLDELPPLNENDIPPQQLKIEDMALAQRLTESPPDAVTEMESVPETQVTPEADSVPETESVPETQAETAPETESVPDAAPEVTEEAVEVAETVEEMPEESAEMAETVEESAESPEEAVEITESTEEAAESAEEPPEEVAEFVEPSREMLSAYPQILTARPASVTKASRRKPTPRKPRRYAETFRTRRRRPGRRARKRRKIARPPHASGNRDAAPRSHAEAFPAPRRRDAAPKALPVTETALASETRETLTASDMRETASASAQRRKLSGKAMRRCFYCLLCGCWLSWPFC